MRLAIDGALPSAVQSFEAIYRLHARYVAGVVYRIMGNDGDVDDIVQDTFIDAMDGIASLRDPGALRGWLVTVAVRRCQRLYKRRARRAFLRLEFSFFSAKTSDPKDRASVDDLRDSLARLTPDLRLPWILHRVEDMTLPDTARACEISLATAKRRIAEADERLERRLAR